MELLSYAIYATFRSFFLSSVFAFCSYHTRRSGWGWRARHRRRWSGGSDSNLVKKCWGPGTPAPQWLADDHCTPRTHALIPTSRTPSPLRWQWMKQCFLMTVVVVAAAVFSDHMSCVIIFAERTVDFFQRTLVGSPLLEMTRLKLIPSNS